MIAFIKQHENQTVLIHIKNTEEFISEDVLKTLAPMLKEIANYKFLVDIMENMKYVAIYFQKYEQPFFFNMAATSYETLQGLIAFGVTDVYIGEQLGFELHRVSKVAKANEIQIRAFPNICQVQWKFTPTLLGFYIRPEDVEDYEEYIDVLEFFPLSKQDCISEDALYEVYVINKEWYGPLLELINGLDVKIDNRRILNTFGYVRATCSRKCLQGRYCNICNKT